MHPPVRLFGPLIHSGQLFKWLVSNREQGDSVREEHIIAPGTSPRETEAWLRWRGYRAVATAMPGVAAMGLVFSRKNGPATVAVVGDVLVWDGYRVTVQED
jgi:hypothetical protein